MRLYDTARARGRAVRAGAGRHACTRAASRRTTPPTSATPRSTSPTTCCSAGCATSATRRAACATSPTSTTPSSRKARELGVHYLDLAAAETARFDDDMRALGLLPAWSEPRATSAIADIRGFIGMVLDRGHAYQAGGGVYFDVVDVRPLRVRSRHSRPRRDARRSPPSAAATSTTRTSATRSTSCCGSPRSTTSRRGSRCGDRAGPGWHIECSALALRELGTTIDLHGGGTDLIFPHHECERAQSEAATGEPFVRHWMHQAMVRMDGEKMSKSLGNLVFVTDLRKEWDPRRSGCCSSRTTTARLGVGRRRCSAQAAERLERWRAAGRGRRRPRRGARRARRRPRHARGRRRHRRRGRSRRGRRRPPLRSSASQLRRR